MSYWLHLYSLPAGTLLRAPDDPGAIRGFIRSRGQKLGDMEFPAGACTLFFVAAEEATGFELSALFQGAIGEAEPNDDEIFGGLARDEAEEALSAISRFLEETPDTGAGAAELAEKHELTVGQLFVWLRQLRAFLMKVVDADADIATFYE